VAADATAEARFGKHEPFTKDDLALLLGPRTRGGQVRALASRWIDGQLLGWFSYLGRDKADANDRVRHEDRRDLRGFGVWAAWVDNVDTLENNTLDTYLGPSGHGHVVHYQQDVGGALGVFAARPTPGWMGHEGYFAVGRVLGSFATLGAIPRPFDRAKLERDRERARERFPELGYVDDARFDPKGWRPILDNPAFVRQTKRDRYWGAKRILAFQRADVEAAIRAGRYRPAAAQRLADVLWGRRERIARASFDEVAPLDRFRFEGDRLCFDDLWIQAGLGGAEGTQYLVTGATGLTSGRCVTLDRQPGYRVVELRVQRPGERHPGPSVRVHLIERARPGAGGAPARNILGVAR
jgi:hypothetical protein